MQIEIISDVLLVNFCEKFVAFEVAEPLDPAIATFAVVIVVKVLIYISRNCIVRIRPLFADQASVRVAPSAIKDIERADSIQILSKMTYVAFGRGVFTDYYGLMFKSGRFKSGSAWVQTNFVEYFPSWQQIGRDDFLLLSFLFIN